MTRFQKEISGVLGEFWVKEAKKELEKIQAEFNRGEITVDEKGILRNCIGRVAVEEVCEKCEYLGIAFDVKETERARSYESAQALAEYRAAQKNRKRSEEELAEMRATFGAGTVIVNVVTGEKIKL